MKGGFRLKLIGILGAALLVSVLCGGCGHEKESKPSGVLLSCGRQVVSVDDYKQLFDTVMAEDFPPGKAPEKQLLQEIHLRLLQQLNDELVIKAYAAEAGISIGEQELEKEVARLKSDYPEGEFERVLLENAVSFEQWKKRLKTRMLMEKVIARQLESQVEITPQDVAEYYRTYLKQRPPEARASQPDAETKVDQRVIRHLRRQKAEAAYKQWLQHIRKRYPVHINEDVWQELIKELNTKG